MSSDSIDRPLSCISGLDPDSGSACGSDTWDLSPNSGFYTVCCDGDIIDFTGFNSYENYTLRLENLLCCQHEDPNNRPMSFDETEGCANSGQATPLSALLATSTEVGRPWTTEVGGWTSTINAECFWSQLDLDEMTTSSTSSMVSSTPTLSSTVATSSSVASSSQAISPSSLVSSSSAASTSDITSSVSVATTSESMAASSSAAVETGLAAIVGLPRWMLPVVILLSLGFAA